MTTTLPEPQLVVPCLPETEADVLAGIATGPMRGALDRLDESLFWLPRHRALFCALKWIHDHRELRLRVEVRVNGEAFEVGSERVAGRRVEVVTTVEGFAEALAAINAAPSLQVALEEIIRTAPEVWTDPVPKLEACRELRDRMTAAERLHTTIGSGDDATLSDMRAVFTEWETRTRWDELTAALAEAHQQIERLAA